MDRHRPILLTSPEGTNSIINNSTSLSVEDSHNNHNSLHDDPPSPQSTDLHYLDTPLNNHNSSPGVQFDAEQLQRGRSRIKKRNDNVSRSRDLVDTNGNPVNIASSSLHVAGINNANSSQSSHRGSRSGSRSFSRSRSRSRSRTASRIRDEEFLKWTVLRQDPSMRLHNYKIKYSNSGKSASSKKKKNKNNNENEDEDKEEDTDEEEAFEDTEDSEDTGDDTEDEEEDEEEEEEDDDDTDEEESDEEQVSDIENDNSINEQFNYDLGTKVLPNFCSSINDVLESSKPWIDKYETENPSNNDPNINISSLEGGYLRGILTLNKRGPLNSNNNATTTATTTTAEAKTTNYNTETIENENINEDSYILYVDLTSESIYAITYVMGTLVKNGDTVYIVHWHSDGRDDFVKKESIVNNIIKLRNHVLHLFDCISATVDNLDVIILSLTHPYPKHLLNEMINGLQPLALCCSLSMTLSGLQNFICSVPTFIIRKKLKRTKKKGIFD
ncbi:Imp21p PWA37_001127 [Arxiozyma heterogenica]|uniref:Imp21p n=1 Tax=Arxiozyma heterogenica TaxID=278026 RepID=UPI002F21862F